MVERCVSEEVILVMMLFLILLVLVWVMIMVLLPVLWVLIHRFEMLMIRVSVKRGPGRLPIHTSIHLRRNRLGRRSSG
jgi:hypothetical protein